VACWRRSFLEEKLVEGKGARIAEREARRKKRRRRWSENASARERERERERGRGDSQQPPHQPALLHYAERPV